MSREFIGLKYGLYPSGVDVSFIEIIRKDRGHLRVEYSLDGTWLRTETSPSISSKEAVDAAREVVALILADIQRTSVTER